MEFFDTHCHIQESGDVTEAETDPTRKRWLKNGNMLPQELIERARNVGVTRLMAVGCTLEDSKKAVILASHQPKVWASIGIHPHEAQKHLDNPRWLAQFTVLVADKNVVAIGECGLDYYYENSPKDAQAQILRFQLELAQKHNLPVIFHVRDAFDDFWPILEEFNGIRGVIHSFTATEAELQPVLAHGLYVGLNGIMTFTNDSAQLQAAKAVPLERMVLETDAPYLTPKAVRGNICEPQHVRLTAQFLAELRGDTIDNLANATTRNARQLFSTE
ncbi:MAG TPA: TatD family hydrolase [Candidatus Saccharimonadales bacterium]|nr:TatD family hydrolase [Candidatus Saccharimonadales bacterium]